MTEYELIKLIKRIVRSEVAQTSMGKVVGHDDQFRTSVQRYATDTPMDGLRSIKPFGLSSKSPIGTDCVIEPIGGDATHLNVTAHFDANRPDVQIGETMLYNAFGDQVYVKNGEIISTTPVFEVNASTKTVVKSPKVYLADDAVTENYVLGQVFKTFMSNVLQKIEQITVICAAPGEASSVPVNAPDFEALRLSPIEDEAILSNKIFGEK